MDIVGHRRTWLLESITEADTVMKRKREYVPPILIEDVFRN